MKKSGLLFIFLSILFLSNAQTINESFEIWPAPGWKNYSLGAGTGWMQSWQSPSVAAHTGSNSALPRINNSPVNCWLVTPQINVASSNYILTFWERYDSRQYYDKSRVHISTTSGDPTKGGFTQIFVNTDTNAVWIQRNIDLSAYAGKDIYIGFQYTGTWHVWFMDDVFIGPDVFTDGALSLVNPTGVTINTGLQNIIVNIDNVGTEVIDTVKINWNIDGQAKPVVVKNNLNLQPGDSVDITLGTQLFAAPGVYNIHANITIPLDSFQNNDTINEKYTIAPYQDAALTWLTPEAYSGLAGNKEIKVEIENVGGNSFDSVDVYWKIDGVAQTPVSFGGLNLQPGEKKYLHVTNKFFTKGLYELEGTISVIGDTNSSNNSYLAYTAIDTLWESFEGRVFPPKDWSIHFGTHEDINFDIPPHGNYYYAAQVDINIFGVVDDTLFTPLLAIKTDDHLFFRIKTSAFLSANQKVIWKDGTTGAIHFLQNIITTPDTWELVDIDLKNAAGVNYIGIVTEHIGIGLTKFDLFYSSARVYHFNKDLKVNNPNSPVIARKTKTENFKCIVRNTGISKVLGADYTVQLIQSPSTVLQTVNGVNLDPWEEKEFSIPYTYTALGKSKVFIQIKYNNDNNFGNNTSREMDVHVVPKNTVFQNFGQDLYTDLNFPFNSNGNTNSLGEDDISQTIYLNNEIAVTGNIYGIYYDYYNMLQADYLQKIPLKIWINQTNQVDLSNGWIPNNQLTLVFDDTVEILPGYDHIMYIPFDTVINFTGLNNLVIQDYAYSPGWRPSILRFQAVKQPANGPIKTISVQDYYKLDPVNPPNGYYSTPNFAHTTFVIDPIVDTGLVSGTVYNINGTPLPGATVSVDGTAISVTADNAGNYTLPWLNYNTYNMTASLIGYNDSTETVTISAASITQDFYLKERTQVTITGNVAGNNDPGTPLENVKIYANGYTLDSSYTNASGQFTLNNIYGVSAYDVTFSMYGYYDTTITVQVTTSNIQMGKVILRQEFIPAFDVFVVKNQKSTDVFWKNPLKSQKVKLQNDLDVISFSYTNEPNEDVWLGNIFDINDTTTLLSIEFLTDIYELDTGTVTIDVFDVKENLLVSSKPFIIYADSLMQIDIPNIVVYDDIFVMIHWQNNAASTHAFAIDFSDPNIENSAVIKYPGKAIELFSDFLGNQAPNMSFMIRAHTLDNGNPFTNNEILSYNIYRGYAAEFPETQNWQKVNTTPVTGLSFNDNTWKQGDSITDYRYRVEALYVPGTAEGTYSNIFAGGDFITSVITLENESDIRIFPVPASNSVSIVVASEKSAEIRILLLDMNGRMIDEIGYGSGKDYTVTYDVSALPAGVYFVQINIDNSAVNKKIVVFH
jgi:CarboxypepD_reg-like domain/Secretion system C-terminal sorting domain/Cleaved Adhesin Domain